MNTITADELKTHLYIVAADEMEGRETGSAGQKKAGVYLIDQYKKTAFPILLLPLTIIKKFQLHS
jgi:hypothetical protein